VTAGPTRAGYYDGRSSKRHEVTLELSGATLHVKGQGIDLAVPLAEVRLEERVANAPRLMHLPRGALIEAAELAGIDELIERGGHRDSLVVRLQRSWRAVVGSMVAVVCVGVAFYLWGLPWAADRITEAIPSAWAEALGNEAMRGVGPPLFRPTVLSAAQRDQIERDLAAALGAIGGSMPKIEYRRFAAGPNAFALPGNTLVMTDGMVALAQGTRDPATAILGVLGHEYGHLKHRHPMRQFVRGSVLSVLIAWWIGDVSSVLATAAPVLLATRYSRDFEREADREAAALLKAVGRPVEPLVELFGKLGGDRAGKGSDKPRGFADYFASHPGTEERIRILRGADN
jgi:Zn-dependent protease with chaperone function